LFVFSCKKCRISERITCFTGCHRYEVQRR
jgi:hypothetical protein